jgi:hypothetical protein
MRDLIWTDATLELLFEQLVKRFGKFSTWKNETTPGGANDLRYAKFCKQFAEIVGIQSLDATSTMFRIATTATIHGKGPHDRAIAAALKAGFTTASDLSSSRPRRPSPYLKTLAPLLAA